jgi:hypothetical protein
VAGKHWQISVHKCECFYTKQMYDSFQNT